MAWQRGTVDAGPVPPSGVDNRMRYPSSPTGQRRRRGPSGLFITGVLLVTLGVVAFAALLFVPGSLLATVAAPGWSGPSKPAGTSTPSPSPSPSRPPLDVRFGPVTLDTDGWAEWAILDQRTGEITGSPDMAETSTTASMVKAWIAADFLRRADEKDRKVGPARLDQIEIMIRDSDNDTASELFDLLGQSDSTQRMIDICGLTDSRADDNWSLTRLSPRDVARLGACIADGRAAGPKWTKHLLKEMRLVRGVGDFGIRKAFPDDVAETIAIKNGWVVRDDSGEWHVNCLAIGDEWTMGVMLQYPANLGFEHGAGLCQDVAEQLRTDD